MPAAGPFSHVSSEVFTITPLGGTMAVLDSFPKEVQAKLQFYVYRLIDPRNGQTFYVGKGQGNRLFAHAKAKLPPNGDEQDDAASAKLDRIRSIIADDFEVIHVVHRHGLTEDEAYHVEGALIDALPGLSNAQDGHYNAELGAMHASLIVQRYSAPKMVIGHRIVFFTVGREVVAERGLYEGCRGVWKMRINRAQAAELAIPILNGIAKEVYRPETWLPATKANFPIQVAEDMPGRLGFVGAIAEDLRLRYVGHRLPEEIAGGRNPVRYSFIDVVESPS